MALELLGIIAASIAASYAWARMRSRPFRKLLATPKDDEVEVVLAVAKHEARARGQRYMLREHLLYGLAQSEPFVAAITRLGGDAEKLEDYARDELDKHDGNEDHYLAERIALTDSPGVDLYAALLANYHNRAASVADLWWMLTRAETGRAAAAAAGVDVRALMFLLVHGMPEPVIESGPGDVHVVLRNDDYTTQEFVMTVLREVFALDTETAYERMMNTHEEGRAVVGRFKLAIAREKVATARDRAREQGFPFWVGVEAC